MKRKDSRRRSPGIARRAFLYGAGAAVAGIAAWQLWPVASGGAPPVTTDAIGDRVQTLPRGQLPVFASGEALRITRKLSGQTTQFGERLRRNVPADVRLRVDARVTTGEPHRRILDIASEVKADLIVMGVPPRSRFDEVLFGSTLRSVLRRTKTPVLVLPVLAGAYEWLEKTQGVEVTMPTRNLARAKRALAPS